MWGANPGQGSACSQGSLLGATLSPVFCPLLPSPPIAPLGWQRDKAIPFSKCMQGPAGCEQTRHVSANLDGIHSALGKGVSSKTTKQKQFQVVVSGREMERKISVRGYGAGQRLQ